MATALLTPMLHFCFMNSHQTSPSSSRRKEYERLQAQLAQTGWISEGYVQDRGPGAGGSCYPWTRKVKGKTICVALSKEQYEWLKEAIANWRTVQETLRQMQRLSREELFEALPNPNRRKRLGKRVLGLV
jgi:cyclopropane fatty-acyl-phospholipid synthase-like methyltransferase